MIQPDAGIEERGAGTSSHLGERQDRAEALEAEIEKHIYKQNLSPEDISGLRLVLESLKRIGEYGTDIAEIVLNLTVGNQDA